jgi:hypothetical protein
MLSHLWSQSNDFWTVGCESSFTEVKNIFLNS